MKSTIHKSAIVIFLSAIVSSSVYFSQRALPFKIESLLDENSRLRETYLSHQRNFNDENTIVLAVEKSGPFSDEDIMVIGRQLNHAFSGVYGVSKVNFLSNAEYLDYTQKSVKLRPFFSGESLSPKAQEILKTKLYGKRFLTEDRRFLMGTILLSKKLEGAKETAAVDSLLKIAREFKNGAGLDIHFLGHKVAKYYYLKEMINNQKFISPLIFVILSLLIYLLFKSFVIVLWVDLIITLSYGLVLLLIQAVDGGLSPYSVLSLTFVLIVATSDLIHFYSCFSEQQGTLKERLSFTKGELLKPCLLTSITTALSFLSLLFNDMAPVRSFGVYCCFGALCAFFLTFYFLPWCMLIFPRDYPIIQKGQQWLSRVMLPFIVKRRRGISLFSLILMLGLVALSTQVVIDDDFYDKFSGDHPLAKSLRVFSRELKSVSSIDLVYPELSYPVDSIVLEDIREFEEAVAKVTGVIRIDSYLNLVDYLGQRSETLKGATVEREGVLFFLNNWGGLSHFFGQEKSGLKSTLYLADSSIKKVKKIAEKIDSLATDKLVYDLRGFIKIRSFLFEKIISNFVLSFSLSFICTFTLFLLLFKSFKWALLALIPNIFPIVLISALMGLLGITVEGNVVMLICVIMGVAVDDTIHFLFFLKKEMQRGQSLYHGLEKSYDKTSKALIGTTMVFVLCFPCFLLSDLRLMIQMGIFIILALIFALMADFILLPALLLLGRDSFKGPEVVRGVGL